MPARGPAPMPAVCCIKHPLRQPCWRTPHLLPPPSKYFSLHVDVCNIEDMRTSQLEGEAAKQCVSEQAVAARLPASSDAAAKTVAFSVTAKLVAF